MKLSFKLFSIPLLFFLCSCKDKAAEFLPKSTFDISFPKNNKKLTNILGDSIMLQFYGDTLNLKITSTKNDNLITNRETGDTIFLGKVCKYRELYFFNEKTNDTTYRIYAVKISDNKIYGLTDGSSQLFNVDETIEKGNHQKLVKYRSNTAIRLHPDKKEMRLLYSSFINTLKPDTIIGYNRKKFKNEYTDNTPSAFETNENLAKVFPNPATDFINVELQQKTRSSYQFADINGRIVLQGHLNELHNKIDLNNNQAGIYLLTINDMINQEMGAFKIIVR